MNDRSTAFGGFVTFRWFGKTPALTLSLPEQIAARIGDRIVADVIKPGTRIIEQDIADEFEVSRGPVREALRILERERLVEVHPRRGAIASILTKQEVSDIFEIRAALYRIIAQRNAEKRSPELIRAYEEGLAELAACAADPAGGDRYADTVFRLGLIRARDTGNTRLAEIITSLALQTLRYSRLGLKSVKRRRESLRMWRASFEAIKRGDTETAIRLAEERIHRSRDEALRVLDLELAASAASAA
jgi:DNA-binding GntR family transcriptional regulator